MIKAPITQSNIDIIKIKKHLKFIEAFRVWCQAEGWRLVVYGGYGLDGYLQTITRNHGDIDLVIYGLKPRAQALAKLSDHLKSEINNLEIIAKDEEFLIDIKVKSTIFHGNFYYVQTAEDPYVNLNKVVKLDGTIITNSPTDFPGPVVGKLGDLELEVQDQSAHLADILRKRKSDVVLTKHDQDIENINLFLQN